MNNLLSIARYTFREQWRHRVYLTTLLFGLILVGGGAVASSLAVDARLRMLTDLGLAAIEFISLIAVAFVMVNLVLQEIENRTLYLLLSHPLPRWQYLTGRYLGTLVALGLGMAAMGLLHAGLLAVLGGLDGGFYVRALLCSGLKVLVVGAAALVLSIFSSSAPTAMAFTLFIWIAGHFSTDMKFLAERSANPLISGAVRIFYYLVPNFSYFNYRDFGLATISPTAAWWAWLFAYSLLYTLCCLILSNALFAKREF